MWDISPPVAAGTPVFPGDAPYQQVWTSQIGDDSVANVSAIRMSPHTGAHADAPLHYDPAGDSAGAMSLGPFIGPCRVIHVMGCGPLVQWQHLTHALSIQPPWPTRILLRTYHCQPQQWDDDLVAIDPDTLEQLARHGVQLVGIDSASVDRANSTTLASHQVLRRTGLRVLENLRLDDVPEGDYELIALPLKLMAAEASPVRAILRPLPTLA